jgi:hypothetical protein
MAVATVNTTLRVTRRWTRPSNGVVRVSGMEPALPVGNRLARSEHHAIDFVKDRQAGLGQILFSLFHSRETDCSSGFSLGRRRPAFAPSRIPRADAERGPEGRRARFGGTVTGDAFAPEQDGADGLAARLDLDRTGA